MQAKICDVIQTDKCLKFEYNGHRRVIKPFIVFRSQDGKILVDGTQVGGNSESSNMPYWRSFKLEKIDSLDVIEGPNSVEGSDKVMPDTEEKYNPNNDRYEEIICSK